LRDYELCPSCGGKLSPKGVETIVRGGEDTAVVRAQALVCSKCREHVYPIELVREFERIKVQLVRGQTESFQPLGRSFTVDLLDIAC
jgi:YgiT-type zinc finger domain-containing protein